MRWTIPIVVLVSGVGSACQKKSENHKHVDTSDPFYEIPAIGVLAPFCEMEEVGRVSIPGEFKTGVGVIGNYAYVSWGGNDYNQGLEVVDISDPANPTVVGHAETGAYWPTRVTVSEADNLVFVSHQWDGVYVFDVSDPIHPVQLSNPRPHLDIDTGWAWRTTDAAYDGRYMYTAGVWFEIWDMLDPCHRHRRSCGTRNHDKHGLARENVEHAVQRRPPFRHGSGVRRARCGRLESADANPARHHPYQRRAHQLGPGRQPPLCGRQPHWRLRL